LCCQIKKIKAALSADKKYWGGHYHDGQGLRYIPPASTFVVKIATFAKPENVIGHSVATS